MRPKQNIWDIENRPNSELTLTKFRRVLKNQSNLRRLDQFVDLAIFEKSTGQIVGSVAIMDIIRGLGQSAFLGYRIHNGFWKNGYGKEAAMAAIDIAFRELKLHRIEAGIEPSNKRSILLAKSIGLRKEGLKKRAAHLRGKWVDLGIYSITCEEVGIPWKGIAKSRDS
ncbi:MAG: GNAT family N-acetyltransferase [Bdellovibrionales bacterium]|nr:GNAT family N-acetyltransferase [Bdellovibrionales bacterium]